MPLLVIDSNDTARMGEPKRTQGQLEWFTILHIYFTKMIYNTSHSNQTWVQTGLPVWVYPSGSWSVGPDFYFWGEVAFQTTQDDGCLQRPGTRVMLPVLPAGISMGIPHEWTWCPHAKGVYRPRQLRLFWPPQGTTGRTKDRNWIINGDKW